MTTESRYALIVSNSEYRDPRLLPLITPDADATMLAEVLRDANVGAFDVRVLRDRPAHEAEEAIERFFRDRKREDLLLLYFTGHGVLDRDGNRLYLAAPNTNVDTVRSTAISAAFIADEMDNCRARRKLLVLDCCYSGAFAGGKSAEEATVGTQSAFKGNGYGRVVLTASDARQYAWENMPAGEAPPTSVFTHHLVNGLKTGAADRNGDGQISVNELYEYVYDQVSASPAARPQTPHLWTYGQQGELYVARSPRLFREKIGRELYERLWEQVRRRDWEQARAAWAELQRRAPDYPDQHNIAAILAGRDRLDKLYAQMAEAVIRSDWDGALQRWATIRHEDPDYADHKDLMPQIRTGQEQATRRRELDAQYEQMGRLARQQAWSELLDIWAEIQRRDPTYPDHRNLALEAGRQVKRRQREKDLLHRRQELDRLYNMLENYCRREQWQDAERIWEEIRQIDPTYTDVRGYAAKAAFEMDRIRAQQALAERRRLLDNYYEEMAGLVQQRKWAEAQKRWNRIRKLDPDYPDHRKLLDVMGLHAGTGELEGVVPQQKKPKRRGRSLLLVAGGLLLLISCSFVLLTGALILRGLADTDNRRPTVPVVAAATARPTQVTSALPTPEPMNTATLAPGTAPQTFTGVTGEAILQWTTLGVVYVGAINTTGPTGFVDVAFTDPQTGFVIVVRQDLTLENFEGIWFYVGSNPRDADTGVFVNYVPDVFRLVQNPDGTWTIDATCDSQGLCAPVTTSPLP